ncbi:MAG: 3-isopropylmalate dehydrogenase [Candidatus Roseilinea sp.]|nr:MAG: 3-isopropylmalate dehydrogenase [Candidatus Roseilinea sp.]
MTYRLCIIPGDGVGREVIPCAVAALQRALPGVTTVEAEAGWDCFQRTGNALPDETIAQIAACGAALFGAVSSPSHKVEGYRSPIIQMRQRFDLYANLRPTRILWSQASQTIGRLQAVDLILVRENTQGLYSGRERLQGEEAIAERVITRAASERIARVAFALARQRERKRVTIVHKANILPLTDGLFRDTVRAVGASYPEVAIDEMLVDTAAMMLASKPARFDVIVTTNLFGDILSDVASVWGGGMGVAPSLNLGEGVAIAEPVHGSAPDIAGKGIANPCGAILSAALLARHHWKRADVAERIERAVYGAIESGARTPDLGGQATTQDVAAEILRRI